MNVKVFLNHGRKINLQLDALTEALADVRARMDSRPIISQMKTAPTNRRTDFTDLSVKYIELQAHYNKLVAALMDSKQALLDVIEQVNTSDTTAATLLTLRYGACKSWRQIARTMNYSESHIGRIHRRALKAVEAVLNDGKYRSIA